ncbi:MAG: ABC transporter permease [Mucinivorans sp.]
MKTFRHSVLREIRRFGHDRTLLIMTIVIPIALSLLYIVMFRQGAVENVPVVVCDKDLTPTSQTLKRMVNSSPALEIISTNSSIEESRHALAKGQVCAIIYIAEGFEGKIMGGGGAEVAVWVDGTFITKSSMVRKTMTTILETFKVGISMQKLQAQGMSQAQAYTKSYPISLHSHVLYNPFASYAYYLLPALLPLVLIIMVSLTASYVIGSEFRYGTSAQWIEEAGGSITRAVASKLAPYLLIFVVIGIFMSTLLYRFLGLPIQSEAIGVLILSNLFLVMAYLCLSIIFVALTSNMRFSLSISAAYTIAAFSFAGLTFPHMAMYKAIATLSTLFPYTYYIDIFVQQTLKGAPMGRSLGDLGVMGLFILLSIAFLPMLKRKALGGAKYHGKL